VICSTPRKGGFSFPTRTVELWVSFEKASPLSFFMRIDMKKTFQLTHPKIKLARLVEAIKHEVKKYIKRERNKPLPEGVDFWDFDCKFGPAAEDAKTIHLSEINKYIDTAEEQELASFYLEILVKPGYRTKKVQKNE
jgi:hypothetical protein